MLLVHHNKIGQWLYRGGHIDPNEGPAQAALREESVSPSAVRDFRGAMAGLGDKGLLITTGTVTADAKKESTRDGAPPIDLVDRDDGCWHGHPAGQD